VLIVSQQKIFYKRELQI